MLRDLGLDDLIWDLHTADVESWHCADVDSLTAEKLRRRRIMNEELRS